MQKNCSLIWQNASNYKKQKINNSTNRANTTLIKGVIRRSSAVRDQVIVFKLPSIIIDSDELLTNFVETIELLDICGAKIFIVHDHTNLVSDTLKLFGFDEKLINGVKVADHKSSQIIEMVLSGHINKRIVAKLCNLGCYAIGISCKDANLIQAKKSKLSHKPATNQDVIDLGFVSAPVMVNPEILLNFEDNNIIPVISPVASDENENTHLLDANLTAAIISSALNADHLILLCEESTLCGKNIKVRDVNVLKEMLIDNNNPKRVELITAAISAIDNSTDCVHMVNGALPDSVLLSIFMNNIEE